MQSKATVINKVYSLLRYALAFEKDYGVRFVDVRIMNIVVDVMPQSSLLTALVRSTNDTSQLAR